MANTFVFDDDEPRPEAGTPAPEPQEPGQPEGGEGNNRTFLIAAIILGGIVLLSLVCMAVYALLILPGQRASKQNADATSAAGLTQAANIEQQTQLAALFTATLPPSETPAPLPTETLVVVFATSTPSPVPTTDPATATVEALQTQLAVSLATSGVKAAAGGALVTPGTPGTPGTPDPTQLAKTGFADEVGLPGLFILSIILVVVILLARRLRQAPLSH